MGDIRGEGQTEGGLRLCTGERSGFYLDGLMIVVKQG